MLAPLNRLEVNALLHHLPQRAHVAQLVRYLGTLVDAVVHLLHRAACEVYFFCSDESANRLLTVKTSVSTFGNPHLTSGMPSPDCSDESANRLLTVKTSGSTFGPLQILFKPVGCQTPDVACLKRMDISTHLLLPPATNQNAVS